MRNEDAMAPSARRGRAYSGPCRLRVFSENPCMEENIPVQANRFDYRQCCTATNRRKAPALDGAFPQLRNGGSTSNSRRSPKSTRCLFSALNATGPSLSTRALYTLSTDPCRPLLAEVAAGNEHASKHAAPGLWALLDRIPRDCWPGFLRGDSGFGTEAVMREAEQRGLPYLFKLCLTANVKKLIKKTFPKDDGPMPVRAGREGRTH